MRVFKSPKSAAAAAAAIVALAGAAPAAAAVTIYTYSGTISQGYDETGVFGAADRDLAGLAFTATFRRDDSNLYGELRGSGFSEIAREARWGHGPSPILASLTIAGGSSIAFGRSAGRQIQVDDGVHEQFSHEAVVYADDAAVDGFVESRALSTWVSGWAYGGYLPNSDYRALPSLTAAATPHLGWYGNMDVDDYLYDLDTGDVLSRKRASAILAPTSLTVTTAVPEPAAWALMLTGFFGAGAAIRSRRGAVAEARRPAR